MDGQSLAEALGMSKGSLSKRMTNKSEFTLDEIYRILRILGLKPYVIPRLFPENGINEPGVMRRRRGESA